MIDELWSWISGHQTLLQWIAGLSLVGAILSILLILVVLVRLPVDYFSELAAYRERRRQRHPMVIVLWHPLKNLIGAILLLVGFLLLFLPGQGVITIVLGLLLVDLPHKDRWIESIVRRPGVLASMNRLRAWFHRPPLQPVGLRGNRLGSK